MSEKYIDKHDDEYSNIWNVLSLLILNKSKIIVFIIVVFIAGVLINQYSRTVLYNYTYEIDSKNTQLQFLKYQSDSPHLDLYRPEN